MRGFQPAQGATKMPHSGGKARGFAGGGPVRGPGTGTSDDIEAEVPEGSYIMPADSTKAVGEGALAEMGAQGARGFNPAGKSPDVPVALSNGEFKLPPEQVHAVGVQALDQIKDATHSPEVRGFNPQHGAPYEEPRQFFEHGGEVREDERRRVGAPGTPSNTWPGSQPARSPYAAPETPVGQSIGQGIRSLAGSILPDTRAVLGQAGQDVAQNMREGQYGAAVGNTVRGALAAVPAVANDTIGQLPAAARGFSAGASNVLRSVAQPLVAGTPLEPLAGAAAPPAPTVAAAAPAAPAAAASPPTPGARGFSTAGAGQWAARPAAEPVQIEPGIYRSGNSYSDSADGAARGFNPSGGQVSAQNMAAADALEARGMAERAGERAAVEARGFQPGGVGVFADGDAARREARNASVGSNLGGPNPGALAAVRGLRAERDYRARATEEMRLGYQAQESASRDAAALQREQMQQVGANTRAAVQERGANARAGASTAVQAGELALRQEAQGFQTRAARELEQLRAAALDPKATAEQRQQALQSLNALQGKNQSQNLRDNFMTVGGGQEWDATAGVMRNVPQRLVDLRTGQDVSGQTGAAPRQAASAELAQPGNRPVGTTSTVNGRTARWDGQKWVPI